MRPLLYTAFASLDHRLARLDGSLDWLPAGLGWPAGGLSEIGERADTIIMGRLTYERHFLDGRWPFEGRRVIVLSRRWHGQKDPHVEFFGGHLPSFLERLKKRSGGTIRLLGGATAARACLGTGLVDQVILTVVPSTLGEGTALHALREGAVRLMLRDSQSLPGGLARLFYSVASSIAGAPAAGARSAKDFTDLRASA